jgi:hypothetical protein
MAVMKTGGSNEEGRGGRTTPHHPPPASRATAHGVGRGWNDNDMSNREGRQRRQRETHPDDKNRPRRPQHRPMLTSNWRVPGKADRSDTSAQFLSGGSLWCRGCHLLWSSLSSLRVTNILFKLTCRLQYKGRITLLMRSSGYASSDLEDLNIAIYYSPRERAEDDPSRQTDLATMIQVFAEDFVIPHLRRFAKHCRIEGVQPPNPPGMSLWCITMLVFTKVCISSLWDWPKGYARTSLRWKLMHPKPLLESSIFQQQPWLKGLHPASLSSWCWCTSRM